MHTFHHQGPAFVSVNAEQFVIDQLRHDSLRVYIAKIQPIRKFFHDGKLNCYSMDSKVSRSGKYCAFCEDAWRCQQKLRLSMLLLDALDPIVLDINRPSFGNLQDLADRYEDKLDSVPVTLRITYDEDDRRVIEFIAEES
jgi:hypothetical protein